MKTKKLILVVLILPTLLFGQDYCPFDFENGLWEANYYAAAGPDNIYRSEYNDYAVGDTIVNDSLLCYKLRRTGLECGVYYPTNCFYEGDYTPFDYELGLICEQDKRIYYNGYLLYDFNVEVGDTIDHWWGIDNYWYSEAPTIISIDSVEMCSKTRRRFQTNNFALGEIYFIEGIGSNAGLIPSYEYFESGSRLICYSDENCAPCPFITNLDEALESDIKIYPNPFKENIFIDTEAVNYNITLFNQNGQVLKTCCAN